MTLCLKWVSRNRALGKGGRWGSCPVGPVGSDIPERPPGSTQGQLNWPQSVMTIFLDVVPLLEPKDSIFFTTSMPSFTWPNTTCLPSSLGGEVSQVSRNESATMSPRVTVPWSWNYLPKTAVLKGTQTEKLAQSLTGPMWSLAEAPSTHQRMALSQAAFCLTCWVTSARATQPESWQPHLQRVNYSHPAQGDDRILNYSEEISLCKWNHCFLSLFVF